jgi:hypothetical protein
MIATDAMSEYFSFPGPQSIYEKRLKRAKVIGKHPGIIEIRMLKRAVQFDNLKAVGFQAEFVLTPTKIRNFDLVGIVRCVRCWDGKIIAAVAKSVWLF